VAERLVHCVRPADTVARLGGDEFAILLEHALDAREVADRVVETVRQPYRIAGVPLRASVSIGIAHHVTQSRCSGETGTQAVADLLLRRADDAMYAAKASGKGRSVVTGEGERRIPSPL
jgi:diguanylate cyclase